MKKTQEVNRQESITKVMKPNPIRNPFELEKRNNELLIENEKLIKASSEIIDELEDCKVDIEIYCNKLDDINKLLNHISYVLTTELESESVSDVGRLIVSSKLELIKTIKKNIKEL